MWMREDPKGGRWCDQMIDRGRDQSPPQRLVHQPIPLWLNRGFDKYFAEMAAVPIKQSMYLCLRRVAEASFRIQLSSYQVASASKSCNGECGIFKSMEYSVLPRQAISTVRTFYFPETKQLPHSSEQHPLALVNFEQQLQIVNLVHLLNFYGLLFCRGLNLFVVISIQTKLLAQLMTFLLTSRCSTWKIEWFNAGSMFENPG